MAPTGTRLCRRGSCQGLLIPELISSFYIPHGLSSRCGGVPALHLEPSLPYRVFFDRLLASGSAAICGSWQPLRSLDVASFLGALR